MLIVPVRAVPVLTATVKLTVALPVPLGELTVIHGTLALAVHTHAVVSPTEPPPPAAGIPSETGFRVWVHAGGPAGGGDPDSAWTTVNDWSAMVRAATRSRSSFGSTVNATTPVPFPGEPEAALTHVTGLEAVHVHPAAVDTVSWKLPPLLATDCEPDPETTYSHGAGNC